MLKEHIHMLGTATMTATPPASCSMQLILAAKLKSRKLLWQHICSCLQQGLQTGNRQKKASHDSHNQTIHSK